jgi:hypothetical protein
MPFLASTPYPVRLPLPFRIWLADSPCHDCDSLHLRYEERRKEWFVG